MIPDDGASAPAAPAAPPNDAHGRAALVLVESLIHGLYERSILRHDDVVEIAERAVTVQTELDGETDGGSPSTSAGTLLAVIAMSLRTDGSRAHVDNAP